MVWSLGHLTVRNLGHLRVWHWTISQFSTLSYLSLKSGPSHSFKHEPPHSLKRGPSHFDTWAISQFETWIISQFETWSISQFYTLGDLTVWHCLRSHSLTLWVVCCPKFIEIFFSIFCWIGKFMFTSLLNLSFTVRYRIMYVAEEYFTPAFPGATYDEHLIIMMMSYRNLFFWSWKQNCWNLPFRFFRTVPTLVLSSG